MAVAVRSVKKEEIFEFLSIDLLKEYLQKDFNLQFSPKSFSNLLFLLGFQGNDFVPPVWVFDLKTAM